MSLQKRYKIISWLFIIPAVAIIVLTKFYPMLEAFTLSLKSGIGANMRFVGFGNYTRMVNDTLLKSSLINTVLYLVQVPIMLVLGLILASILNSPNLKFKGFFRTMIFIPCITAAVSYSMIFRTIFGSSGLINNCLLKWGVMTSAIPFLEDPWLARMVIIVAMTWRWTGYNTMFYLSGLQTIDPAVYEAARIDGANSAQIFRKITIPLLKPVILMTVISSINGTMQLFAETKNITNGGPGNATITLSNYIYKLSFEFTPNFGYASAVSYIIFIIVAVLALVQMKVGDKR